MGVPKRVNHVFASVEDTCVAAGLAMATGYSYEYILEAFFDWMSRSGEKAIPDEIMYEWLATQGFAVQHIEHDSELTEMLRTPWPPEPWAPLHLCTVQSRDPSHMNHMVVMEADGIVIDSQDDCRVERLLTDYRRVYSVTGVWDLRHRGAQGPS